MFFIKIGTHVRLRSCSWTSVTKTSFLNDDKITKIDAEQTETSVRIWHLGDLLSM